MADMGKASSFLPTIKCSMCAREIEISQMGDHVCGGSGERKYPLARISELMLNNYSNPSTGFEWQLLHHATQTNEQSQLPEARTSDATQS
jgi:hypothetical protein